MTANIISHWRERLKRYQAAGSTREKPLYSHELGLGLSDALEALDACRAELARVQPVVEAAQSLTSALEANTIAGPSLKSLMAAVEALDGATVERTEGQEHE